MATVITREEFLRACQAKKEQERREEEERLDREFENAVDTLPIDCQEDFTFNGNTYSIDYQNRQFTRTPIKGGIPSRTKTMVNFLGGGSQLNKELGIF